MSGSYPTEEFLQWVQDFKEYDNLRKLFDAIAEEWSYADWGWFEKDAKDAVYQNGTFSVREYKISTAGWSGNEDIIEALRKNWIVWSQVFYIHRTGGHYVFKVQTRKNG